MIAQWPSDKPIRKLAFLSDLHLFSARSSGEHARELIAQTISEVDLCVWGGDLFDFRWSRLSDEVETVRRAIGWLESWYDRFPETTFLYLNGNHDVHQSFVDALSEWERDRDRFHCGVNAVCIQDTLLTHGDVIECDGDEASLSQYRSRWSEAAQAGRWASQCYDVAVAMHLHRFAANVAHRNRRTVRRLSKWIQSHQPEPISPIRRVVFGHTHRVLDGYSYNGYQFFNGGAAIRNVSFKPVVLDLNRPDEQG